MFEFSDLKKAALIVAATAMMFLTGCLVTDNQQEETHVAYPDPNKEVHLHTVVSDTEVQTTTTTETTTAPERTRPERESHTRPTRTAE